MVQQMVDADGWGFESEAAIALEGTIAVLQEPVDLHMALWLVEVGTEPMAVGMVAAEYAAIGPGGIEARSIARLKLTLRCGHSESQ